MKFRDQLADYAEGLERLDSNNLYKKKKIVVTRFNVTRGQRPVNIIFVVSARNVFCLNARSLWNSCTRARVNVKRLASAMPRVPNSSNNL